MSKNNPQREAAQRRNKEEGLQVKTPKREKITVGPASDPRYPGADFVSNTSRSGKKETMLIDKEGTVLNPKEK